MKHIKGNIVDVHSRRIFFGEIIYDDVIKEIRELEGRGDCFILPGLIDSHVHIESSMLVPFEFSKLAVSRGTVGVVADPHEIGNVLGVEGVNYMIENSKLSPMKFFFGAPSCVPATVFDSSGGVIDSNDVCSLMQRDDIWLLSEMMNFPGVVNQFPEVLNKIQSARDNNKPIDGHAPGLVGESLEKYIKAGISTDHECFTIDEAIAKINLGVTIQIREGSAARNFEALWPLIASHSDKVMFCTDDSHPDDIIEKGHIDKMIKLGLSKGLSIFDLLKASVLNPVNHYNLPVGLLQVGDSADFIVVDDISTFNVLQTHIKGELVFKDGHDFIGNASVDCVNNFSATPIFKTDLSVSMPEGKSSVVVIDIIDGELVTNAKYWSPVLNSDRLIESSPKEDILKIMVINRYNPSKPFVGFITGFGIMNGAIGCSISHDSHNIIVVGDNDDDIVLCTNSIIANRGGVAVSHKGALSVLPLPVAGIMSNESGVVVADRYKQLHEICKLMGCKLQSPFMLLSFMSLLVIPKLKISDKGLFDVDKFDFIDLFN